jgi:hypothetical protein
MKYRVTDCHIKHDKKVYTPGDVMELTEEQAQGLHVEPYVEPAPDEAKKGKKKGGNDAAE